MIHAASQIKQSLSKWPVLPRLRNRQLAELRSGKRIRNLGFRFDANTIAAHHLLLVSDLFHPKARGGAVEEAEESEVVVFARLTRQLDYRSRLLKNLSTSGKHEMVVGRDLGKGNLERRSSPLADKLHVYKPSKPMFFD